MKTDRGARAWALAGTAALIATLVVGAKQIQARRAAQAAAVEDLRDAVAQPTPAPVAAARVAGKTVPSVWFKSPEKRRAEIDDALMSSRRRRAGRASAQ